MNTDLIVPCCHGSVKKVETFVMKKRLDLQILKRPNHMNRPQTQFARFVAHSRVPVMIISTLGDRQGEGAPGKPQGSR